VSGWVKPGVGAGVSPGKEATLSSNGESSSLSLKSKSSSSKGKSSSNGELSSKSNSPFRPQQIRQSHRVFKTYQSHLERRGKCCHRCKMIGSSRIGQTQSSRMCRAGVREPHEFASFILRRKPSNITSSASTKKTSKYPSSQGPCSESVIRSSKYQINLVPV
jgi:hypothetical protein